MEYEAAGSGADPCFDIRILFPEDGIIRVESAQMFADQDGPLCRRFVERSFQAPEIEGVLIAPAPVPAIELQFDATQRGIGASVVTNNVAALGALANGLWPMRKVAQLEAETAASVRDPAASERLPPRGRRAAHACRPRALCRPDSGTHARDIGWRRLAGSLSGSRRRCRLRVPVNLR